MNIRIFIFYFHFVIRFWLLYWFEGQYSTAISLLCLKLAFKILDVVNSWLLVFYFERAYIFVRVFEGTGIFEHKHEYSTSLLNENEICEWVCGPVFFILCIFLQFNIHSTKWPSRRLEHVSLFFGSISNLEKYLLWEKKIGAIFDHFTITAKRKDGNLLFLHLIYVLTW